MWYAPTKVQCKKCKRLLNQQEYTWVEQTSRWNKTCLDCENQKARDKKDNGDKVVRTYKKYVKNPWMDAMITLSNRKIKGKDITEKDIKQIIDEGYFFILKNY